MIKIFSELYFLKLYIYNIENLGWCRLTIDSRSITELVYIYCHFYLSIDTL